MTTTDTAALQERIARALYENAEYYGPEPVQPPWDSRDDEERGEWMEIAAAVLPITARLEAQSDIRGRAVVIYRDRARKAEAERDCRRRENAELRDELVATQEYGAKLAHGKDEAEARIEAVRDVLDRPRDDITMHTYPEQLNADIRRALDGDA